MPSYALAHAFEQAGIGLHSGEIAHVTVKPAPTSAGRVFVRVDLPNAPAIPAHISQVRQTTLSTELAVGDATVRTVEHLLAALSGMGIADAMIEIDGPEVPLLDGSALPWVEAIAQAGRTPQPLPQPVILTEPLWVRHEDAFVAALPAPELRFTYGIDFDLPAIGNQWVSWSPQQESFEQAIAPARTFGLAHQIEHLQAVGLIKGGSLDNALVCGPDGWLNPPLRFSNEPVRHKLLDLVGDLSLVGIFPQAHYLAYKASHQLHTRLAQQLITLMPVL
ncbi:MULTISPECIES: UDP-3-O-acyl-N-acetylglucosamine deacetylase [unclassified Leptolyngbya]|uniref:UDP-3-O-acyl-N-acetylglucosamine deacetylase n=1 Tax=unclassified Leptolyngbya TaxID=2650499 RepID=UPI0016845D89|nr:UDP-3-O-acyl-N-acetylglucosamine deacetylase [Leptolyngbya sp. FACHB-8]MBD2156680.1 UDP-3-O-acyl-N-acetylglucosamine deacetylase [Leptolyngbya sp. FACHB-16]